MQIRTKSTWPVTSFEGIGTWTFDSKHNYDWLVEIALYQMTNQNFFTNDVLVSKIT